MSTTPTPQNQQVKQQNVTVQAGQQQGQPQVKESSFQQLPIQSELNFIRWFSYSNLKLVTNYNLDVKHKLTGGFLFCLHSQLSQNTIYLRV